MKNNPNIENKFKRIFVLCPEFACLKKSQPPGSTSLSQLRHQHPEILSSVVLFTEILLRFFGVRNDCVTPRLPARGADLSVSVRVLEGLDQSQCLVHGSPDREIIHGDLAQRSFRINDKQTPETVT